MASCERCNITDSYILTVGWGRDTRDNIQFPSSGLLQNILLETGLPIGDLYYYKLNYLAQYFLPLPLSMVAAFRGDFGYGGGLGGKTMPFFKAYYAGGVGSVRGYESASLGPQDVAGNTLGGRQKVVGNAELFFPMPGARPGDNSVRFSVFADAGEIRDAGNQPQFESFRYSIGAGIAWNSPVGPLKVSYALPLKKVPGDRIQNFQFQVGQIF